MLPDDDALWDIFEQGHQLLTAAGYQQYETSAYAKPGYQCQHNLNYWRFGDYIGIGCGTAKSPSRMGAFCVPPNASSAWFYEEGIWKASVMSKLQISRLSSL